MAPGNDPVVRAADEDDVPAVCALGEAHIRPHYAPLIGDSAADEQVRRWWNASEIGAAGALERRDELDERGFEPSRKPGPLLSEREQALSGAGVELLEEWQEPFPDQPALRRRVGRVHAPGEPMRGAVLLRLLAPDAEERPDDAVRRWFYQGW